jgi:transcriptional regulator
MYQPEKYKKKDNSYICEFIAHHPFATFVTNNGNMLATHIPVLLTDAKKSDFTLFSHMAKHNEQVSHLRDGAESLVIFQGAHGYVSSSWYEDDNISTWDYSAVHVNATLKLQTEAELRAGLEMLVHRFEKDQNHPKEFHDLPLELIDSHVSRIVGFYLIPTRVQGIAKYHQGSSEQDIRSVIDHLEERNQPLDPELIKRIKDEN